MKTRPTYEVREYTIINNNSLFQRFVNTLRYGTTKKIVITKKELHVIQHDRRNIPVSIITHYDENGDRVVMSKDWVVSRRLSNQEADNMLSKFWDSQANKGYLYGADYKRIPGL